jgi:hypothetical protein
VPFIVPLMLFVSTQMLGFDVMDIDVLAAELSCLQV